MALSLRLGLAAISQGTNDALIWEHLANRAKEVGLIELYRSDPLMNHPPLPVLWARVALLTGSARWFSFVMKLPAIVADVLAVILLARIGISPSSGNPGEGWGEGSVSPADRSRLEQNPHPALPRSTGRGNGKAVAIALSPVAILISGYHCNTDNVYAFLSLLAMYFIATGGRFFLAGLALAAAINVKLIPVLLIPVALSFCRSWRNFVHLGGGLAIGIIPFLPLLAAPNVIASNMLSYTPPVSEWGVAMILHAVFRISSLAHVAHSLMETYLLLGRWIILGAVLWVSIASWKTRRWNPFQLGTLSYAIFLVLTPGFGPQYTVIVVPLLASVSVARSWAYGVAAGIFLLMSYWSRLVSYEIPLRTLFPPNSPTPPGASFGLIAWFVLLVTAVHLCPPKPKADA